MSQTDPKTQQPNPKASAGKPAAAQPPPKAGDKKQKGPGGMQGLWYVIVLLLVGGIFAIYWVRKNGDEPRPVVSAAEEEDIIVEPEPGAATEMEAGDEMESEAGMADVTSDPEAPALVITSNVRGADVYLNGKRVGKTPHKATPLPSGDYDVRVVQKGYVVFEKRIHVDTPDDSVRADLRPVEVETSARDAEAAPEEAEPVAETADILELSEAVGVKHKHRLGSCEGVLRASRDGLRYDSAHKDAFFVAFADIEELNLDGDQLTLKVRDGRKYDFNERNDNEEALATFHDRVDEAATSANE